MYKKLGKPFFDIMLVLGLLTIFILPAIIVAGLILVTMGRPVFFSQQRIGKGNAPFNIYKFRTMRSMDSTEKNVISAQRITKLGHFLRITSLDEIPQLLNVLKREMSIVGPRPLLIDYLPLYSAEQRKRHNALPGITGLAQISGRSSLSWAEKFSLDVKYVADITFIRDISIILSTAFLVLLAKNTIPKDAPVSERFNGKN